MEKYSVTGGCGFIGTHLVNALIAQGHAVSVIDDLSSGKKENLHPKARLYVGDVRDSKFLKKIFASNVTGCFHLAAIASVEQSNKEWATTHSVNALGTVNVFEAAARQKIPVVYASSASIYGANTNFPLSEEEKICPLTAYGIDKYSNELHGKIATSIHNIATMGLRFFNVYGPYQDPHSPYSGVISIFIDQILQGNPFTINGSGHQVRDFIYVKDVVNALIAGMEKQHQTSPRAKVYNVCTGMPTSLIELTNCLEKITGKKVERLYKPKRLGDIQKSYGNPQAMVSNLGITAQTSLEEGLQETVKCLISEKERLSHAS